MQRIAMLVLVAASVVAVAQKSAPSSVVWQMQDSGINAGLRGIYSVDDNVAWASGTGGTVLKTIDGGAHWLKCAVPDAATDGASLDFRGMQAWDAQTAIVMASGAGEKSRLYKTEDGCKTWKMLARNAEKDGFWDAIIHPKETYGDTKFPDYTLLVGDPINGHFDTRDGTAMRQGIRWEPALSFCQARPGESVFAASNSSVNVSGFEAFTVGTGGKNGGRVLISPGQLRNLKIESKECLGVNVPIANGNDSSGIFSLGFKDSVTAFKGIAVGGDYTKPNESTGTAAWTDDGGLHWTASAKLPRGFRSAVQWSDALHIWITVGTNGSDISRDDGKTWQPLDSGNWNALSLPFVVGPNGRIARVNPSAIALKANLVPEAPAKIKGR
jgi:hypothetical protein